MQTDGQAFNQEVTSASPITRGNRAVLVSSRTLSLIGLLGAGLLLLGGLTN